MRAVPCGRSSRSVTGTSTVDPSIGGDDPGRGIEPYLSNPKRRRSWVAEVGGRIVAFAGLRVHGEEGEIEPIAVSPLYRVKRDRHDACGSCSGGRQGYGRELHECEPARAKQGSDSLEPTKPTFARAHSVVCHICRKTHKGRY